MGYKKKAKATKRKQEKKRTQGRAISLSGII
jgi:hypothetical protein